MCETNEKWRLFTGHVKLIFNEFLDANKNGKV